MLATFSKLETSCQDFESFLPFHPLHSKLAQSESGLHGGSQDRVEGSRGLGRHIVQRLSAELRTGFGPAYDSLLGFFHAVDWTEPWLICLILFHVTFLLIAIVSRKNVNFQLCLSLMAFSGVYLAERINRILGQNWKNFASQNYFDSHGLFISAIWSAPLLLTSIIIVVNTLLTLCHLIVKWKRTELRHRARVSRGKQD